ncbi:type II secretion system F family protein [Methylohalobius crimeensis]|uniref:type II secretion system F family protein n=1 Tax=Methylohalobius crimeensis TaxID=244365 RepID=UPI0003B67870|nr:type II secretion system F family protein [Methylohalobius crimeensis]
MTVWYALGTGAFLIVASALLLVAASSSSGNKHSLQRFNSLLKQGTGDHSKVGAVKTMTRFAALDEEIVRLLQQAGWYKGRKRFLFGLMAWGSPAVLMAATGVYAFTSVGMPTLQGIALLFMAFAAGFLLPRYVLRFRAKARRHALARETPTAIYLLIMLFDAGLSTEHALKVIQDEGTVLMPHLTDELAGTLQRIDAGHDPADALGTLAAPLDVDELTDTVAILKQVTRYGGNIRDSLVKLARLIEERQQSALREYVNKLSAKMTVVMMVFLFPALLIFLAGPGFLALARGLMEVYGG